MFSVKYTIPSDSLSQEEDN